MEQAQSALQDVSFEFVERIHQGDFPDQRVTGKVRVRKPQGLRVDQATPEKQRLISDGKKFWLYSSKQGQQLTGDWQAWLKRSRFPVLLIDFVGTFTPDRWRHQYTALYGGHDDGLYQLRFKPLTGENPPVTLWVSDQTFLPVRGSVEQNGATIKIEIQNLKTNTGLDESLFAPNVPKGTEDVPLTL